MCMMALYAAQIGRTRPAEVCWPHDKSIVAVQMYRSTCRAHPVGHFASFYSCRAHQADNYYCLYTLYIVRNCAQVSN
jgi:hypothetical protein|eukprot:COSAG01_NODE_1149_length_11506_cov_141.610049_4_plen_77_part_00